MSVQATVTAYVVENFARDLSAAELRPDADLRELGILNSLGLVRLVAWLGEHFDIPVADLDFEPAELGSVDRIVAFVSTHRASNSTA